MDASISLQNGGKEMFKAVSNVTPSTPGRKKALNGSSTPGSGKKSKLSPSGQTYAVGSRVEAKDFSGHWNPARVSEVDLDEREVLIHFDKYEEWMPMDSQRIRPYKEPDASSLCPANLNLGRKTGMNGHYLSEPKSVERRFKVGDQVMATWSNNRKYPATIASHQPNDRYDVVFYDGFSKSVRGSKISKLKESDTLSKHPMNHLSHQVPPHGNHLQMQTQFLPNHQQLSGQASQLKNQQANGNFSSGHPINHSKQGLKHGQTQLEKQLLQPVSTSLHYSSYGSTVNGLMPMDENIGTKEQRRERKRKHNVKELFSTKRPRGSDKLSKGRVDKKSGATDAAAASSMLSVPNVSSQSSANGLLLGVDPMFPANPLKVEGLPGSSRNHDIKSKVMMKSSDTELKKKRRRFKKKRDGSLSDSPDLSQKRQKALSSDDDECSIQWTNGEPQGEAAYVIESAEGLRKSIIVDDRRLPVGWSKHAIRRQGGTSAGKWDVFLVRPETSPMSTSQAAEGSSASSSTSSVLEHTTQHTSHQSTSHSASHQVVPQGVQRVKTLLPRRTSSSGGSPNRRVLSPPPPHAITPQPVLAVASSLEPLNKKSLSAGSDGYVCPKDGCGKRFRKENLLQMHIKHYHPEYTAFMGSTPNVADLAYARTVGEPVSETPYRNRTGHTSSFMEKIEKISRMEAHRKAGTDGILAGVESPSSLEARSPTLGQLLKKGPMRKDSLDGTTAAAQAAAAWMVETASDSAVNTSSSDRTRDKLSLSSQMYSADTSFRERTDCTSRPVSQATDCDQDTFSEQNSNQSPWKGGNVESASSSPVTVQPSPSYFYSKKKKNRAPVDKHGSTLSNAEGAKPTSPAMEHLRREELINCTCGFMEEDGLMIQCDLCLCWQHGLCNQIENIEDVPQKYVCQICLNPVRERKSRHYIHDQDWLKEGVLPSLSFTVKDPEKVQRREDILKRSHDLCSLLLMTQKVIHSLRVKVHIAELKDHPKLYLWANSWQTESMGCPTPPSSPTQDIDVKQENFGVVGKGKSLLQEALLNGSPHQQQQQLYLQLHQSVDAPRIPQPEAPIDPSECRLKLLDHIEHYQSLIDARLAVLEQMIDDLEKEDPLLLDGKHPDSLMSGHVKKGSDSDEHELGEDEGALDFYPQTKETVQMILKDLLNLRKISTLC